MRHYLLYPIAVISLLVGCGGNRPQNLGPEGYKAATGAAQTVEIVANDPAMVSALPEHSTVLQASSSNLKTALRVDKAEPGQVGTPLVTAEELAADPQQAAATAVVVAAQRDEAVRKEQEATWFAQVLEWGGWGLLAGGGLFLCRLLGVPGVQYLSDPLVRWIGKPWISKIEQHEAEMQDTITTLWTTVEGSMAGRGGLAILDKLIGDKVANDIKKVTQGQASTIEGLFKWLAKAHVVDGQKDQQSVNDLLDDIKNQMDTTNGLPSSVMVLLGQALNSAKA